jgi:hypothetical protein
MGKKALGKEKQRISGAINLNRYVLQPFVPQIPTTCFLLTYSYLKHRVTSIMNLIKFLFLDKQIGTNMNLILFYFLFDLWWVYKPEFI